MSSPGAGGEPANSGGGGGGVLVDEEGPHWSLTLDGEGFGGGAWGVDGRDGGPGVVLLTFN